MGPYRGPDWPPFYTSSHVVPWDALAVESPLRGAAVIARPNLLDCCAKGTVGRPNRARSTKSHKSPAHRPLIRAPLGVQAG
jgi:hypothetical protein